MQKITNNIYIIQGRNNGRFPFCHCFYIKDEINVLIDSAAGDEELKPLKGRVDIILNTHYHPDHIRGNSLFPGARILCHLLDTPPLTDRQELLRYTGFGRLTLQEQQETLALVDYRESPVHGSFSDGDLLDFGRTRLRVIHTPGHSPGHCCFLDENSGILMGGDIDLTSFGPWYGHDMSDLEAFERSMVKVISLGVERFLSCHEEAYITTGLGERLAAYAAAFRERDDRILSKLRRPLSLDELAQLKIIYPRHPKPSFLFLFFERNMLDKHLQRLEKQELVQRHGEKYTAANGYRRA